MQVSIVFILNTLLVRDDAFRWDRTGVQSLLNGQVEALEIKAVDIYEVWVMSKV